VGFGAKPHKKLLLTKNILTLALSFFGGLRKELVWQQQGYYPFGMALGATLATAEPNRMMYNGKELQDYPLNGMELGWYDYGARFYDPMLGRWHVVDPMAEEYYNLSPHAYCANNPIKFIDPDGRSIGAITSSFVTPDGTLIEHRDDGDPRVYLVRDPDAWRKNGSKKEDAEHVGYEYPEVDYASMVGKQVLYYPSKAPFIPGFLNDGPIEKDYTLETMFIPVFGWLKCLKFGGKYLWGFWNDFAKVVYKGKTYSKVGGRLYSRHAIDRMVPSALGRAAGGSAERSVSTNIVEEVIKNGNRITRLVDGIVRTEHVLGDVHVITEEAGKVVVTVITK